MNTSSTADDLFLRLMREAGKVSEAQCKEATDQASAAETGLTSPYRILIERGSGRNSSRAGGQVWFHHR